MTGVVHAGFRTARAVRVVETPADRAREVVVEAALPQIGLRPPVMSDGPIGVRGVRWTADDRSVALPSPTAPAATWGPGLAHRAGVLLRNSGARAGREVVQLCLAPAEPDPGRPARWLAGFAGVEVAVGLPCRAFEIRDQNTWAFVKGSYEITAGRSIADRRLTTTINV